jgi:hypothetical protein
MADNTTPDEVSAPKGTEATDSDDETAATEPTSRAKAFKVLPDWRSLRQRISKARLRTKLMAAAATGAALLVAATGFLNDGWDLIKKHEEATTEEPSIEAIYQTEQPLAADGSRPDESQSPEPGPTPPEDAGPAQPPGCASTDAASIGSMPDTIDSAVDYQEGPFGPVVHPEVIDADPAVLTPIEMQNLGGYVTGQVRLDIAISNATDQMMTIYGVALDVERNEVPNGTVWLGPGGMASPGITTTAVSFDLREETPEAITMQNGCVLSDRYFDSHQIQIDPGGNEIIQVHLWPGDCLCLVRTNIEYSHDNKWASLTVPDDSEDPVTVVGVAEAGFQMVYEESGYGTVDKYDCRAVTHGFCSA